MFGITSYGAYIPRYRISHKTISSAMGFLGAGAPPGEKAVANFDEDSLTMAVAAGVDCLRGIGRGTVDGVYLASTTLPYTLRQNSGIVGMALDVNVESQTADFAGSTKSGTTALLSAAAQIAAGDMKNVLICTADRATGKPGSPQEHIYGDGAAAVLLGSDNVVATIKSSFSLSCDFPDRWKSSGEMFDHTWEDRFIRDMGYTKIMPDVIAGLMKKYNLAMKDITKLVFPGIYTREHASIAKELGADASQVQSLMLDTVGDTGPASAFLMLVASLEEAKPGDRILFGSFGNGGDAILLEVTEGIKKGQGGRGVKKYLASKKELTSYEKYVAFRNTMPVSLGARGEEPPFTSMSLMFRDRKAIFSLSGSKCKHCGTPQYPPNRICVNPDCWAVDQMEEYRFSDKKVKVFSYTGDNLTTSIDPPAIAGLVDFEGGGRWWVDFTDCSLDDIKVGMPMEMTFRRKYIDDIRGIHVYFWKAMPPRTQ